MKNLSKILLFLAIGIFLMSGTAMATYINWIGGNGGELNLQQIMDNVTISPATSSIDFISDTVGGDENDALLEDAYWQQSGSGLSASTFIIELAGYASGNSFGVYDKTNPDHYVELFGGGASAGSQVMMGIKPDGSVEVNLTDTGIDFAGNAFGYYLHNSPGSWFYSDTDLNVDEFDHMAAFQGNGTDLVQLPNCSPGYWIVNEFVLAWEDVIGGGDNDYNDMVLMVESVNPIPEPATMLLLGSGLFGLAVLGRKKFFKKN